MCWAVGGLGSLLGSILLLFRSRAAVAAFIVSAMGLAGVTYFQLVQERETLQKLLGDLPLYFSILVWAVLLALIFYARRQVARGVLR